MTSARSTGRLLAGRYALVDLLGHGPASAVWKAQDERSGRIVAVKELRPADSLDDAGRIVLLERLLRDGRRAARFSHPGAVPVHDVFEENDRLFVVMDLFTGPTLARVVNEGGPLPPDEVALLGSQLAETIEAAHREGLTHGDVTPGNVVVLHGSRALLTDFAVGSPAAADELLLTPFTAPEQVAVGSTTAATDIWALGATLRFAAGDSPPAELDAAFGALGAENPGDRPDAAAAGRLLRSIGGPSGPVSNGEAAHHDTAGAQGAPAEPEQEAQGRMATVREPWFFPVPVEVAPDSELGLLEVDAGRAPPAPRPAASRMRIASIAAVALGLCVFLFVLLLGRSSRQLRVAAQEATAVPSDWLQYTDAETGLAISRPPDWTVTETGPVVDFRDPDTGAVFRVDTQAGIGTSPHDTWLALERAFAAGNPSYERVRLVATRFQEHPASIWEYKYRADGQLMQAVQLGFVSDDDHRVTVRFQSPAEDWSGYQEDVAAFETSLRAP